MNISRKNIFRSSNTKTMHTLFISSGQQIHNCQKWNRVFSVYVLASGPHWPSCNLKRIVAVKHFFIHIHINNNKNFNINGIAQNTMHLESTILRCRFKWHVLFSAFCVFFWFEKSATFNFKNLFRESFLLISWHKIGRQLYSLETKQILSKAERTQALSA